MTDNPPITDAGPLVRIVLAARTAMAHQAMSWGATDPTFGTGLPGSAQDLIVCAHVADCNQGLHLRDGQHNMPASERTLRTLNWSTARGRGWECDLHNHTPDRAYLWEFHRNRDAWVRSWKQPVRQVYTDHVDLTDPDPTIATGQGKFLLMGQNNPADNGPYVKLTAGNLIRVPADDTRGWSPVAFSARGLTEHPRRDRHRLHVRHGIPAHAFDGDPTAPVSMTCPDCWIVSPNPNDARERYCGRCHWWTGAPEAHGPNPNPAPGPYWLDASL